MKAFVTGVDGYIGVLMAACLRERGHTVDGLDTGFYRRGWLYGKAENFQKAFREDIRFINRVDLRGYDAVVHLAELSNDPLGELNRSVTFQINHQASVDLAIKSKDAGVPRFIYASSCSVYGIDEDGSIKNEESPLNPQTAYAECKVLVEWDVSELADGRFSPTFLRNATAYGPSPRMRFDIVVNNLTGLAFTTGEIRLTSDGTPWRPLVHVEDICQAFAAVLEAPRDLVHNQVFNVGSTRENYQMRDIAEITAEVFPGCEVLIGDQGADNRSYRVSFEKIGTSLPGFSCQWPLKRGVVELRQLYEKIGLTWEMFTDTPFIRLNEIKRLIADDRLNEQLFWKD